MINERTSLFLMANLGAEVSRLLAAREQSDYGLARASLARAERILDEVLALPDMKSREEELQILHDSLKKLVDERSRSPVTPSYLKSYFTPFALRFMATR